jgi:uncharacterized protein YdcH (DUF465 family)
MAVNALLRERLEDEHRRLDEEIERMLRWRWTAPCELQQLKKQKLAIKDRLHRIAFTDRSVTEAA